MSRPVGPEPEPEPESDYDTLRAHEQALVRAEWARRMEQRLAELDFAREFAAAGLPYSELDEHGNAVRRQPASER